MKKIQGIVFVVVACFANYIRVGEVPLADASGQKESAASASHVFVVPGAAAQFNVRHADIYDKFLDYYKDNIIVSKETILKKIAIIKNILNSSHVYPYSLVTMKAEELLFALQAFVEAKEQYFAIVDEKDEAQDLQFLKDCISQIHDALLSPIKEGKQKLFIDFMPIIHVVLELKETPQKELAEKIQELENYIDLGLQEVLHF